MTLTPNILYCITLLGAFILSLILTPAARAAALILNIIDHPHTDVKTHKEPVPYLGGVAIMVSFSITLLWIRALTSFPTGTLKSLRGILVGGFLIFALGLIDDIKYTGLHYRIKLVFQVAAASILMLFGMMMQFIQPIWFAFFISGLWIVGLTNALNIIDIMDGLASGTIFIASLGFLFISLPTEAIYVNFAAAALAGATLGFMPFNLSKKRKIFMGDTGSLFIGFVASALSLGTSYQGKTDMGLFAPLLILAIPIYDTLLVFYLRIMRGASPFLGSHDHFPLRLERLGWSRMQILSFVLILEVLLCLGAYLITRSSFLTAIGIYTATALIFLALTLYVVRVKIK